MSAKKPNPNLRVVASTAGWKELELGGTVTSTGNSKNYRTGNWVPKSLEFVPENCINCGLCWAVCPDDSILLDEKGNMIGIDLDHCKDCGLCVEICPPNKNPDPEKHALKFRDEEKSDF